MGFMESYRFSETYMTSDFMFSPVRILYFNLINICISGSMVKRHMSILNQQQTENGNQPKHGYRRISLIIYCC